MTLTTPISNHHITILKGIGNRHLDTFLYKSVIIAYMIIKHPFINAKRKQTVTLSNKNRVSSSKNYKIIFKIVLEYSNFLDKMNYHLLYTNQHDV